MKNQTLTNRKITAIKKSVADYGLPALLHCQNHIVSADVYVDSPKINNSANQRSEE